MSHFGGKLYKLETYWGQIWVTRRGSRKNSQAFPPLWSIFIKIVSIRDRLTESIVFTDLTGYKYTIESNITIPNCVMVLNQDPRSKCSQLKILALFPTSGRKFRLLRKPRIMYASSKSLKRSWKQNNDYCKSTLKELSCAFEKIQCTYKHEAIAGEFFAKQ